MKRKAIGKTGKSDISAEEMPTILVPGWGAPHLHTRWVASLLEKENLNVHAIKLPYLGVGDMDENAAILSKEVERLCSKSRIGKVNLVGYSLGGLIARIYLQNYEGVQRLGRAVFVGSPQNGIYTAYPVSFTKGGRQVRFGSDFMRELNKNFSCRCDSARCLSIYLSRDIIICPSKAARIPCGYNLELKQPIFHWSLVFSHEVIRKVADFLKGKIPENVEPPEKIK